ncbi:MAG: hypothetical protein KDK78_09845 [Chlamydiia bacterium]|nr:hypothetical protein [Chlamydiia bacterium]
MFRNPKANVAGFCLANAVLVWTLYQRIDSPTAFFFIAGGLVTFSFFLKRAIDQFTGA